MRPIRIIFHERIYSNVYVCVCVRDVSSTTIVLEIDPLKELRDHRRRNQR